MPMILQYIDAIARQKKRDVLFLKFDPGALGIDQFYDLGRDWNKFPARMKVTEWLDENKIDWMPCGGVASLNCGLMSGSDGRIYMDVPFDTDNEVYKKVSAYLENEDGTVREEHAGIGFFYYPLEMAMKNSAHDQPGFWEHYAETEGDSDDC